MAGGRVRANTAVFYNDYQDLQVQSFLRPGVLDISNAASATIRGIEFEVAAATGTVCSSSGNVSRLEAIVRRLPRSVCQAAGRSTRRAID